MSMSKLYKYLTVMVYIPLQEFIMKVLSFDVSSVKTGYSIINNGIFVARAKNYGTIEPDAKLPLCRKLAYFRDCVEGIITEHSPDIIAIEDVFIRQPKVAIMLARFSGVIIELSGRYLDDCPMMVSAIKARSVLGITNTKPCAFEYVRNRYKSTDDWTFKAHNDIADSVIVGLAVWKEMTDAKSGGVEKKNRGGQAKIDGKNGRIRYKEAEEKEVKQKRIGRKEGR